MWRSFHLQVICSAAVRTFIPRDYKEARNSASQVMSLVKPRNAKGRVILARGPNPGSWKSEEAGALDLLLALWSSAGRAHNSHYVACFWALLHGRIVASFSGGPSPRPTAKTTRGEGRGTRRSSPRTLAFPSWGLSKKHSSLNPRGKEKVRSLRSGSLTPESQRPKKRELSPAGGVAGVFLSSEYGGALACLPLLWQFQGAESHTAADCVP